MQPPLFSIITPTYNMLRFLPVCCNSVSDQNVEYEHIVVDGASTDGTVAWLEAHPGFVSVSEKDQGMYDAINKGICLSKGDILAYLNCDEQYLAGALKKVQDFFLANPSVDILFGDALIVHPDGRLLAFRKGFVPRWQYVWASHMYVHSSSMFVRRRVIQSGILFNANWKTVGDADFVVRVLRDNFSAAHIQEYLSAFLMTGSNLGDSQLAQTELRQFRQAAPWYLRYATFFTDTLIRIEKLVRGLYFEKMPIEYSVFTLEEPNHRSRFAATNVSPLFPKDTGIDSQNS